LDCRRCIEKQLDEKKKIFPFASYFNSFSGHLGDSAATLASVIREIDENGRKIETLGEYAMLKKSEDGGNSTCMILAFFSLRNN